MKLFLTPLFPIQLLSSQNLQIIKQVKQASLSKNGELFGVFYANITNVITGLADTAGAPNSKLHERDVNAPFSRKQTVAVYRKIENMLINPAWGIEPRRHVTLLSKVATCVSRNQAEGFRQTRQQHQQHPEAGSTRSGEVPQLRVKRGTE